MSAIEKKFADRWYSQLLPVSSIQLNEFDRNYEFLSNLGVDFSFRRFPELPTSPLPETVEQPIRPYFVLFPGAGAALRRWSPISLLILLLLWFSVIIFSL